MNAEALHNCVSYIVPTALSYANHLTVHDETLAKRLTGDLPCGAEGRLHLLSRPLSHLLNSYRCCRLSTEVQLADMPYILVCV